MNFKEIKRLGSEIIFGRQPEDRVVLTRRWEGNTCSFRLGNYGENPTEIREVRLFTGKVELSGDTRFYGEGYNMLSQYGGTVAEPENIGAYSDRAHYRLPEREGYFTAYNMVVLEGAEGSCDLIGFASCHRYRGEIRLAPGRLELALDMEGLLLCPGESRELEKLYFGMKQTREEALRRFAVEISKNHSRRLWESALTGWCSWYAYGPSVTDQDITDTIRTAAQRKLPLKYIQIDDGYQLHMGDWLEDSGRFSGGMEGLCQRIRQSGFEPAVWAAPFIAEKDSALFLRHQDWFIQDGSGRPLSSGDCSFGGWRHGPWYMLDLTHPAALHFLTETFRIMREKWGCRYFKLDALMWGALPFGERYDRSATSVSAYRAGMAAIRAGCGGDCYLVGANAPMWPSIGALEGMRVANDVTRRWERIRDTAGELWMRHWQNESLWRNDPDCVLLQNLANPVMGAGGEAGSRTCSALTEDEFSFHKAAALAAGGAILSGDRLTELSKERTQELAALMECCGRPAVFAQGEDRIGRIDLGSSSLVCVFNPSEETVTRRVWAGGRSRAVDFWSGDGCFIEEDHIVPVLPPHSARVFRLYDGI